MTSDDNTDNAYRSEQGVRYAVGMPLPLPAGDERHARARSGDGMADKVANNDGGPSGALDTSSATLDLGARTLDNLSLSIKLANTAYAVGG